MKPNEQFPEDVLRGLPDRKAPASLRKGVLARLQAESVLETDLVALHVRRAPASLRERVLERLEARARAPWWQRSWNEWNAAQRGLVSVLGLAAGTGLMLTESHFIKVRPGQEAWNWVSAIWQALHECAARVPLPFVLSGLCFLGAMVLTAALGAAVLVNIWKGNESHVVA
jgi:hypothetical protein